MTGMSPEEVTASASLITQAEGQNLARLSEPWQTRAFTFYDLIGEIHYASNFYARGMTGVRFYAAEIGDDGKPQETEDQDVIDAVARITDPGGVGRDQLTENYGRIQFVAGAGYMLWTPGDPDEPDSWEFVSNDELRINEGKEFYRYRADGLPPEGVTNAPDDQFEPLPDEVRAWRYWTPHPRLSMAADSPMRAVLDLCEELWLLTRVVRARVKNRLAGNGILLVPNEISPPPVQAPVLDDGSGEIPPPQQLNAPEDPKADPFLADMIRHLVAPIQDEGSAAAVTPLIVRGPAEALKAMTHLVLRNAEEKYEEVGLRDEAIRRIALGLDMPPEKLLGMGGVNHWSGWIIDEETWENIRPVVRGFCGNITSSYLIPYLREELQRSDADRFLIWYDPSDLLTDPDRGVAADAALDRNAISKEAYREARGFTEEDAPTPEEEAASVPVTPPAPATDVTAPVQAEPGTQDEATAALQLQVMAGAEVTIERARELAGNRICSFMQGKEAGEYTNLLLSSQRCDLPSALGKDAWVSLTLPEPTALVRGAGTAFRSTLTRWGVDHKTADSVAHLVEMHAAMTLLDPKPPPMAAGIMRAIRNGH
jgi:hypothetical protein